MPQLRRKNPQSLETPITAELLEARSLLSGAAAVHAAVHHALTPHPAAPTPTPPIKGTLIAEVNFNGGGPTPHPGILSLPALKPVDGATVKGSFTTTAKIGAASFVEKATFSGKVVTAITLGGLTTLTVQPSGGSYAVTVKPPGHPTVTASAAPTTSYTVTVANGRVEEIVAHYKFPASAPGGLANNTVDFDITLG